MDFIPDTEFHEIFNRVTRTLSLTGCTSTEDINRRLKKRIKQYKKEIKENRAGEGVKFNLAQLKKLLYQGFARRIISEAIAAPQGKVSLTLQYGPRKAEEILLARARKRLGPLTIRKRRRNR